jgi:DNA modification methylase
MVSQVINGDPIHLVAEDLPYNLAAKTYTGKGKHKHGDFEMVAGELSHGQFIDFMARSFEVLKPHCVQGTLIYAFMDWRHTKHLLEAGERAGFELKNIIVWDKVDL